MEYRLFPALLALQIGLAVSDPDVVTKTVAWWGDSIISSTILPCVASVGPTTIVIGTPLEVPTCVPTATLTIPTVSIPTVSIPTTTLSLPTATATGACLVNPLCKASGLDIDYYYNPIADYSRQASGIYSNYYIVDGLTPMQSSQTNETFFESNPPPTGAYSTPNASLPMTLVYAYYPGYSRVTNGGITVDANNFTLVYSGLYRAPATGTYQLCAEADNENDIYFGDGNAFSCDTGKPGTAANPILNTLGPSGLDINTIYCTTVDMIAGFSYPIRNVIGNWQGPSAFNFTITPPGATVGSNVFDGTMFPRSCGIYPGSILGSL